MTIDARDAEAIATKILAAGDTASSISPITDERLEFDLRDAYDVLARIAAKREARGERRVGWKIGFTNETIWDEYGVDAPIWGPMYATTADSIESAGPALALAALAEPRIEPEIAFRLGRVPDPGMDETELLACIDAVAHGFEIVQSIFPAWRFQAADTVAAFALHGRYRHGPFVAVAPNDHEPWRKRLAGFQVSLLRNDKEVDRGVAGNVLGGGPLTALRHFVRGLRDYSPGWSLAAGEIVTTGTVTRAFPVAAGERWTTEVSGLPLPALALTFA